MSEGTQRRLAAIVAADVVAYSRLMGVDEAGTLAALRNHRAELIDGKISERGGRIVKTMGDGLLLEFPSVVDATQCVIDVQVAMAERNKAVDEEKRIVFRIGVHLGDLVVEGDDIFGDGINIAARLEALCEAGGVAISGTAHENIAGRIEVGFVDAGDQQLKNISRPVRVWQWTPIASPMQTTGDALALPDKPSIAVLPFDNMSGDPEQEYFSDGMTEEIVNGLARFDDLFVVSRQSTYALKKDAVPIRDMAQQLGVKFILDGSVQRMGNWVRISVRLLDSASGGHLWSERYDREIDDYFALQDEISERVISIIAPAMTQVSRELARRKAPVDMKTWDYLLRGEWHIERRTPKDTQIGRALIEQAIAMEPSFAAAHARLALAYGMEAWGIQTWPDWEGNYETALAKAVETARYALTLEEDHKAYITLCTCSYWQHDYDTALFAGRRCIELNPNSAAGHMVLSLALTYCGEMEEALPLAGAAIRLGPNDPLRFAARLARGLALYQLGRYDEAVEETRRAVSDRDDYLDGWIVQCAVLGQLGQQSEAEQALGKIFVIKPEFSQSTVDWTYPFRDSHLRDHLAEGLRRAGLSE
jgi:adenylate cyclase